MLKMIDRGGGANIVGMTISYSDAFACIFALYICVCVCTWCDV